MSVQWRTAWIASTEETKDEFVELARVGENLLVAKGGARPSPGAQTLTNASDSSAFSVWCDQYESAYPRVSGMPLGVLFAGVSGWDVRADALVRAFADRDVPEWNVITQDLAARIVPNQQIAAIYDWFASRGPALARGNDLQKYQERAQRSWWWGYISVLPRRPAEPAQPQPAQPQPAQPASSSSSTSWGAAFAALVVVAIASRKRRGRR